MDTETFDALSRRLAGALTRRGVMRVGATAAAVVIFPALALARDLMPVEARKKKKKKKKKRPPVVSPPPPPPPPLPPCDDGVACTDDARAANGTCTHTPNDSLCRANQVCHREQCCGCGTGFRNCSGNPAGDGCECQTPGCCRGGTCQTTHANGLGQNYYDCVALGTYDQTQAEKARAAFADIVGPGQTVDGSCGDPGDTSKIRCHDTNDGSVCACWAWSGPLRGYVRAVGGPDCECPTTADAPWN
jgi:hypothetical protein